jgi:hypothetical protein
VVVPVLCAIFSRSRAPERGAPAHEGARRATVNSIQKRALGPYTILLISLLAFILMVLFVSEGAAGDFLVNVGITTIFLAGFYVARGRRSLRRFALPVVGLGIVVEWLTYFLELPAGLHIRLLLDTILFLLVAAVQLHSLLQQRRVSADTVIGGINTYLLFALCFMLIHSLVEVLQPGSYSLGGAMLSEYVLGAGRSEGFATMLYFSFVTLTTLGYGDIVPVSGVAKMLASGEALFGQIYLAVFIARLVALHVAGARDDEEE